MARTIKLNGSDSGTALTSAAVNTLIQNNSEFVLDKRYSFTSPPSNPFTVIPTVDFDNVASYMIVGRGLASTGSHAYRHVYFDSTSGNYGYNGYRGNSFSQGNQSYSSGQVQLSPNSQDTAEYGPNDFTLRIFINESGAPNNGRRHCSMQYSNQQPTNGYYQYKVDNYLFVNASQEWSSIGIGQSNSFVMSSYVTTPSFTVYKQLRAPAS